jgi:hypothetical protein
VTDIRIESAIGIIDLEIRSHPTGRAALKKGIKTRTGVSNQTDQSTCSTQFVDCNQKCGTLCMIRQIWALLGLLRTSQVNKTLRIKFHINFFSQSRSQASLSVPVCGSPLLSSSLFRFQLLD